jgi:hypothetical protein
MAEPRRREEAVVVEPSDLNLPAPTAAESANNPTRTIQYEFRHFFERYRNPATNLRRESLTPGTPFYVSMNANEPNFQCSRDSFYLSLLHLRRTDQEGSVDRFRMCALQGIIGGPVAVAAANPVDAAIHGYSILINDLILTNQGPDARSVVEFLQIDYSDAMSETGTRNYYDRNKKNVLALLGDDYNALVACPQRMRYEVLQYLLYVFRNEQRYIASSPTVKKAIAKFVITYRQPNMVNVYDAGMTIPVKVHFFAFILNQTQQFIDSLHMSQAMENYMVSRLDNNASDLSVFLGTVECGYLYPNAAAGAVAFVAAAAAAAQAAAAQVAAAQAAAQAAAAAAALHPPYVINTAPAAGGGGNQKRTLRKIKSKSIKSKSIKSKLYKKKINRKKSCRRYRRN